MIALKAFNKLIVVFFTACFLMLVVSIYHRYGIEVLLKSDYISFVTGGRMIGSGAGRDIYNLDKQFETQNQIIFPNTREWLLPFKSPPYFGLLMIPFTYFPVLTGYWLFASMNLLLLGIFVLLSKKHFFASKITYLLLLPLAYWPNYEALYRGQTSFIVLIILFFIYVNIIKHKSFETGGLTAMLLFKPQYLLILPFLFILSAEKMKFVEGFSLVLAVLLAVSVGVSGVQSLLNYPNFLLYTEIPFYGSFRENMFTLASTLSFFSLSNLHNLMVSCGIGIFMTLVFYKKVKSVARPVLFSAAVVAAILLSSHSLIHDLVVLQIPIFIFVGLLRATDLKRLKNHHFITGILLLLPVFSLIKHEWLAAPLLLVCFFLLINLQKTDAIFETPKHSYSRSL